MKPEEQSQVELLESGRHSFSFSMKLMSIAYRVSKRKFLHFYLPGIVLAAAALIGCKFFLNNGMPRIDGIGTVIAMFAFYSWMLLKFIWVPQALDFFKWIEFMFGPKTKSRVLDEILSGKVRVRRT